ncbi:hypothetical protein KUTeg_023114, partial [Tegillarca granosa]
MPLMNIVGENMKASVFFVLFITIDRILAVKYPFKGPKITKKISYMMVLLSWIISLVAAVVPGQIYYRYYSYSGKKQAEILIFENIIISKAGFQVPDVVYAWVVVFVLPVNSAINPFLYTLGPSIKRM